VEIPIDVPPDPGAWPEAASARVQVDLAALSHSGLTRSHNEDNYLIVRLSRAIEALQTSLPVDVMPARAEAVGYGLIVADGMGGVAGGEVASRTAIATLVRLVLQTPNWIMSTDPAEVQEMMRRFADRYRQIQATLRDQGRADPSLSAMGTTMTIAGSFGDSLMIGHIGDSRAYLLRQGTLCQLTRDHTLVQALVNMGCLTPEEAAKHPRRHVLTRSLAAAGDTFEGDFQRGRLVDGDQVLLCTDGLTEMVDNATISSVLRGAATAKEACQALVDAALKNGGKDNVTVALARYRFPQ
jgi:protein phosphatase